MRAPTELICHWRWQLYISLQWSIQCQAITWPDSTGFLTLQNHFQCHLIKMQVISFKIFFRKCSLRDGGQFVSTSMRQTQCVRGKFGGWLLFNALFYGVHTCIQWHSFWNSSLTPPSCHRGDSGDRPHLCYFTAGPNEYSSLKIKITHPF